VKKEKMQKEILAFTVLIIGILVILWILLNPVTFWQKFVMLIFDIVVTVIMVVVSIFIICARS